ncbi:MAG: hydroxyacid dehydrogenase [Acidobacteria bacterium]|nr:hydroxyacid dehydrogenase [Acidobacteriota bacterium]
MELAVLDAATFGDIDISALDQLGNCRTYQHTPSERILDHVGSAEIVVTNKVPFKEETMRACPQIRMICVAATGTNNIDLDHARRSKISVCNVPDYATKSAVSHTLALYFQLAHHMNYLNDYCRSGSWTRSNIFTHLDRPFRSIHTVTWGVVGMGAIGRAVADAVSGLGAKVVYHSTSGANLQQPYEQLSLDALVQCVDVISLHAALNSRTRSLFNGKVLARMKPNALLINVARGGLVNSQDLAHVLLEGRIGGAGIDVLPEEPPPADEPLLRVNNQRLVMTPHVAGLSVDAREALVREVVANVQAFQAGSIRNSVL